MFQGLGIFLVRRGVVILVLCPEDGRKCSDYGETGDDNAGFADLNHFWPEGGVAGVNARFED